MKPFAVDPEYLALVDPATLEPVDSLEGPALLAVAARVGPARLIDNAMLEPPAVPRAPRAQAPLLSLTQSRTEQRCSV
jgi:hypothetical protein